MKKTLNYPSDEQIFISLSFDNLCYRGWNKKLGNPTNEMLRRNLPPGSPPYSFLKLARDLSGAMSHRLDTVRHHTHTIPLPSTIVITSSEQLR